MVEIGSHDRDGCTRHNDGVAGYDAGILHEHAAGSHEGEGDDRSIRYPKGKDDVQVVGNENDRSGRFGESHPEAALIVSP